MLSYPDSQHKNGRDEPHNTLLAALDCMSGVPTDTAAGVLLRLDLKSGHTCNQQPTRPLGEGGYSALEHLAWDVPASGKLSPYHYNHTAPGRLTVSCPV